MPLPRIFLLTFALTLALTSCETEGPIGSGRRPPPRVLIPSDLGMTERELLPEVQDALSDAGFHPTYRTPADFILHFEVDDGPVNADVHLRLLQHGEEVARAYARTGGPGIIVHRREYIRRSFDKCLDEFEDRIEGLARFSAGRSYDDDGEYDFDDDDRYDDDWRARSPRSGRIGGYERGY